MTLLTPVALSRAPHASRSRFAGFDLLLRAIQLELLYIPLSLHYTRSEFMLLYRACYPKE